MRVKPAPGIYHVTAGGLDIELHVTEEGAWHLDAEGQMVFWFWIHIEGGPLLVSLTKTGCMFLALNEDGTADFIHHDNESGEQTGGEGAYAPA